MSAVVSIFGHVLSHSGHIIVPRVGYPVTSVLGHVQSHSRGGHVACSSASLGTVAHSVTVVHVVSSDRLSVLDGPVQIAQLPLV